MTPRSQGLTPEVESVDSEEGRTPGIEMFVIQLFEG